MSKIHKSEELEDDAAKSTRENVIPDDVTPEELAAQIHRRKDELLDAGVEETFPASDPVAVKHIT